MNVYLARKLELQRLARARQAIVHQVEQISQQIQRLAEARAILTIGGNSYCFGRHSTTWRSTHERAYRAHMAHLQDARGAEIRALERKLLRQDMAIEAFRRRHGLNIDAAELLGRNLRYEIEKG